MSQSGSQHDDGRFDSALSLALDQNRPLRSMGLHNRPASPSWSPFYLRQDSRTNTESTNETSATSLCEEDHASIAQAHPAKTSRSTLLSSSPLASSSSRGLVSSKVISCDQCGTTFSGDWRQSNLRRHKRHVHPEDGKKECQCRAGGCSRTFNRQDARSKHERKTHPELHQTHTTSQQWWQPDRTIFAHASWSTVPTSAEEASSHPTSVYQKGPTSMKQLSHLTSLELSNMMTPPYDPVSRPPLAAWHMFVKLHAQLEADEYSRVCDSLFTSWELIAEECRVRRSTAYNVYAQVLADMYSVVAAIDCDTPMDDTEEDEDQSQPSRQHRPTQGSAQSGKKRAIQSRLRSSASSSSSSHGKQNHDRAQNQKGPTGGQTSTIRRSQVRQVETPRVDCPFHKYWRMFASEDVPPPCQGCSATCMSQVRKHVKEAHVGREVGEIECFQRCGRCKRNFVDSWTYACHKSENLCGHAPDPRGDIITPWVLLYLDIYIDASQVPIPFTGVQSFLTDAEVSRCLPETHPFLGGWPPEAVPGLIQASRVNAPSTPQRMYNAMMVPMLQQVSDYIPPGSEDLTNSMPVIVLHTSPRRDAEHVDYEVDLYSAQAHLLDVLRRAPQDMSIEYTEQAADFLQAIAEGIRLGPAASVLSSQASEHVIEPVFTDPTLSPQTDQTVPPEDQLVEPSVLCSRPRSAGHGAYGHTASLATDDLLRDLHLHSPSSLELGAAADDADLADGTRLWRGY